MSRASSIPGRNLTLTEELEKLEQSITLTLQEIDHNFSRAHQIVTGSILPIVGQYAEHSQAVWEGAKFWKQFFEASANVSLSGYEEQAEFEGEGGSRLDNEGESSYEETTEVTATHQQVTGGLDSSTQQQQDFQRYQEDPSQQASDLDSSSMINSTPTTTTTIKKRPVSGQQQQQKATFASYASPYEALRQEYQGSLQTTISGPTTPNPKMAASIIPQEALNPSPSRIAGTRRRVAKDDVLLHRVLDKTYRIQATPHKTPSAQIFHHARHHHHQHIKDEEPDSALSSPDIPQPPQLNPDLFSPSTRRIIKHGHGQIAHPPRTPRPAPKPGQSVFHTPGQKRGQQQQNDNYVDDDDEPEDDESSDEDEEWKLMSPPKTIQFSIPPNQLLQTPAREASKHIVQHLLHTAGANNTTTTMLDPYNEAADVVGADDDDDEDDDDMFEGGLGGGEPTSPMVIRGKRGGMVDDTF